MIFGQLAGFLALLGLPALLLIHLLQRRRRRVLATTSFLLEHAGAPSVSGRRLDRLRSSASLWLQIGVVLAITWLLIEPRFARQELVFRAAFVLDSSASMSAFRSRALAALERRTAQAAGLAAHVDWTLFETAGDRPALYSGRERGALLAAARAWAPTRGGHDMRPALEGARQLVGPEGLVAFLTDHDSEPVAAAERIAVGAATANVGFVAGHVARTADGVVWRAILKNHGAAAARRSLRLFIDGREGEARAIELPPRAGREIGAALPRAARRLELHLEPDAFTLDDRLPLVVPEPRRLRVHVGARGDARAALERFVKRAAAVSPAATPANADLCVSSAWPPPACGHAVVLLGGRSPGGAPAAARASRGMIVAAAHPLMRDLSWHGLLLGEPPVSLPEGGPREVLLWAGEAPLIALDARSRLLFAFDPGASNVERLPAFPLLLNRFFELARRRGAGIERANFETGELLDLAFEAGGPPLSLELEGAAGEPAGVLEQRAPWSPGFFRLFEGGTPRIEGAAHFADAREADLSTALSRTDSAASARAVRLRMTRPDPLAPLALLVALGLLLADWALGRRGGGAR